MTVLRHVGCALLGAVVCLAAVAEHRSLFPWGLTLALVTTFAVPVWLMTTPTVALRSTGASYVAGWVLVLLGVLPGRPEGDYALASDPKGFSLLGAGFVLLGVGVVSLALGRRRGP
jgi:hypothetical protein